MRIDIRSVVSKTLRTVAPNWWAYRTYLRSRCNHKGFYGGYDSIDMATYIDNLCKIFLSEEERKDFSFRKKVIVDIIKCHWNYGTNPTEYFCYGFLNKNDFERATYLPRKQKDDLLISQMGKSWEKNFAFIKDKNLFYKGMRQYFRREACQVESPADRTDFCRLLEKYGRLICKPTHGGCGNGIEIVDINDYNGDTQLAFNHLLEQGAYIAEEIVKQDPRISEWNASSLNTFRIPTFRTKDGIKIFYPSIRIGRSGSIVDNAGAGGTFAAVDAETGLVVSDGFDKLGHHYLAHPDSGKPYKGQQIPEWDALKEFVTEVHSAMPKEHKYIAYDMALSTRGWVVIEANWGEVSMPQIELGKGLKREFKNLLFG
jgi:hypothetical protein